MKNGFIKVAAASPVIRVCDCDYNADRVIETMEKAEKLGVKVLVFPALTLTGATCRERDRMEQVRIPISEVKDYIAERVKV